jgi:hypothetical protein
MLVCYDQEGDGDHIYLIMMERSAPPLLPPFMIHFHTRKMKRGRGEEVNTKVIHPFILFSYSLA